MRIRFLTLLLALVFAASAAQAADLSRTVCGYSWDVAPHQLAGFSRVQKTDLVTTYKAPEGIRIMDEAPATEALFAFNAKGRLFAVYARAASTAAYNTIMDSLMEEFGNPVVSLAGDVKLYLWERGDTKIKLTHDKAANTRTLAIYDLSRAKSDYRALFEKHADEAAGLLPDMRPAGPARTGIIKF